MKKGLFVRPMQLRSTHPFALSLSKGETARGSTGSPRAVTILLLLLLTFSHLFSPFLTPVFSEAPALSLPAVLDEARRANPALQAARKEAEAAQARIPLSRGLPAPRIGIEFEEIPRGTVKLDRANLILQFIQALPFPGKLSARQKVAVKEAQVAAATFKRMEWEVITQVKDAYAELFLLGRHLEIARELEMWLAQAAAVAEARYATGAAPQAELLRAQAEALEADNQIGVLQHRRQAAAAHLNHLLNRPAAGPLGAPQPIPLAPVPSTPEELLALAEQGQPELLVFKFSAERAEAAWRLSKRELLPDLETMLKLRDPAMGPIGPWDLSLGIMLPFWFWTKQRYGVKAALYDKESAQAAFEAARAEIARRVHGGWHRAQGAYQTARLCQERLIPLGVQAVESALAAYQGGKGTFMDLLDALRAWSERNRTYADHLIALEQEIFTLEQAVGAPLREWNRTPEKVEVKE